ncbi:MAG: ArsR family transcriptional regulator [Proteobacteria bacterium]|nr:ArsR family transcriptional regulator [Nanoarchaeota archaeon]MBU1711435.1 ArsR family transcriptional regulator [Pseudomonadota bacterium]
MVNKQFWKDYSFIMRSKQRKTILLVMERPMTVTEIKNKTDLSLSDTSRVLRRFKIEGLAKCINPEDHLGRIYQLSERGEKIKEKLEKS